MRNKRFFALASLVLTVAGLATGLHGAVQMRGAML